MALDGSLKTAIARAWHLGGRLMNQAPALTILYYHAVPDQLCGAFSRQMGILAAEAEVVFADHNAPAAGTKPLVAITFDDAFESVARNALPILDELGLPATIFAPSRWLGQNPGWVMESQHDRAERVMDAATLHAIQSDRIRIGSHSVDHIHMADADPIELTRQASESRSRLQDVCGKSVDQFAFPYGSLNLAAIEAVAAAGYLTAYSVMPERIHPSHKRLLRGRTAVEPSDPEPLFRLKLNGAFNWMPIASRTKRALFRRT